MTFCICKTVFHFLQCCLTDKQNNSLLDKQCTQKIDDACMPNLLMLMGVLQIMLSQHHFLNTLHTRNIFSWFACD